MIVTWQTPTVATSTLSLRCGEPDAEKAGGRDGTGETPVENVVAMPICSFPGVFFEPEVIGLMSEALEAACKVLRDDELLQRPVLASGTQFACGQPRLLHARRNWLKRATVSL